MNIVLESAYKYLGYTIIDDNKAGIWRVKDSDGKYLDAEFSTDVDAEEYIDGMNESKVIKEATSDYIKIGNTIYPKDMSKYSSDATAKEVADQAKKQYDDDVQKEKEEKRNAAYRKGKEWVEWAKDNESEARNQLRKMLSELWPVLDNKMIESILDKFPMGNVQLMYWMMLTKKPYTVYAAHINRDYNKFSDNYKVYLHRKELEKGEWYNFIRNPSMYVGTDGTRAYFIQIYHSYYMNPSTSLSETCGMDGSDGLTIIDVSDVENETSYTFDELFNKLVPGYGKSGTLAGEIVRAWSRVMYRFYNDGDMISEDEPYGGVDEGARFVCRNVHDKKIEGLIDKLYDETDSKKYSVMLSEIKDLITDYINKNPQLLKIKNSQDYLGESKRRKNEAIITKSKDDVRTDLSKVEGSMSNTLTAHKDELASISTVRELVMALKEWFKEDGIDTPASNRLIMNVMKQRDIISAQMTVYNSILKGSGLGVLKEDAESEEVEEVSNDTKSEAKDDMVSFEDDENKVDDKVEDEFNSRLSNIISELKNLLDEASNAGLDEITIDLEDVLTILDK